MYVLQAENLRKTYRNKIEAVRGLDMKIKRGEVFGFLGPNGAGKSTSINMFAGLLAPTSGKMNILGFDMPREAEKIREKIGYVPQDLVFYSHLTVYENMDLFAINYGIDNRRDRIEYLLNILEIYDLRDRKSNELSGGQRRRLNLAIGLINQPELLILDEPSAGMDAQSRNILWEIIRKIAKDGMTIILTTHLMETADRLSDTIAIIDDGVIKVIGTPDYLKKMYGEREIFEITWKNLPSEDQLKELKREFEKISMIENYETDRLTTRFETIDGVNNLVSFVMHIEKLIGKVNIQNISLHENTLEDVFIQITGKKLRG